MEIHNKKCNVEEQKNQKMQYTNKTQDNPLPPPPPPPTKKKGGGEKERWEEGGGKREQVFLTSCRRSKHPRHTFSTTALEYQVQLTLHHKNEITTDTPTRPRIRGGRPPKRKEQNQKEYVTLRNHEKDIHLQYLQLHLIPLNVPCSLPCMWTFQLSPRHTQNPQRFMPSMQL